MDNVTKAIISGYIDGFTRHYPNHRIEVKTCKGGFKVYINDEAGDLTLTREDLQEATKDFNR